MGTMYKIFTNLALGLHVCIAIFFILFRDVHETFWAETETRPETQTFKILSETRPRRCSFQDTGRDFEAPETIVKHIDNEKKIIRIN